MSAHVQLGLVGQHISYSLSPAIYDELFKKTGVEGKFTCFDCNPGQLTEVVHNAQGNGFKGLAVTIPHKSSVMPLLDEIDEDATGVGAVNAICFVEGRSTGFNTDVFGFAYTLRAIAPQIAEFPRVLIIGVGGAASACTYALLKEFGVVIVAVLGRSPERMGDMKSRYARFGGARLRLLEAGLGKFNHESFDLIVNATPLGGPNAPDANPIPEWADLTTSGVYFDLNYNADNRAVQTMHAGGHQAIDGSTMLVAQAVRNFELWTGARGDIEAVRRVVFGR